MKKSIIISVKPKWVEKILNGEKTIEIRKSMPKCDLPIDVYIYCTKSNTNLYVEYIQDWQYFDDCVAEPFMDYKQLRLTKEEYEEGIEKYPLQKVYRKKLNGKVLAKFTLNKVEKFKVEHLPLLQEMGYINPYTLVSYTDNLKTKILEQNTCLLLEDIYKYAKNENVYAWHIENLEIFNPNELLYLHNFYKNDYELIQDKLETVGCNEKDCGFSIDNSILGDDGHCDFGLCPKLKVLKEPQSWFYAYLEDYLCF